MLGLVLCGGHSSRMGTDKGLLKPENKTWSQAAADKMRRLNIEVKISVNASQFAAYSDLFDPADLICDNQSLSVHGPLLGVLTCHLKYPAEDLFVFACDMPLMESCLLDKLMNEYRLNSSYNAYIFCSDNKSEPLCGIYTAKGLAIIIDMLREGRLERHSMKFTLDQLHVNLVPISEDQKKQFRNFNTHADLNGL
ncbi:MAG: molybdenum cofactor guanylyltransferase [Chitinophagaceae bacterium]|nr:MAG: molybdenum cofactor guanylyltransferase [Chitinophagaceae bacterium]